VEALAADYLEAVRSVLPHGPYRLGGWSFGALVALEMARELSAAGEQVSLVLIDPSAPAGAAGTDAGAARDLREDDARAVAFLARDLAAMAGAEPPVTEAELEAVAPERRLDLLVERAGETGLLPPGSGADQLRRIAAVYRANARAAAGYRPEPLAGEPGAPAPLHAVIFFAADAPGRDEREAAWRALLADRLPEGPEIHELPGDHYAVLRDPGVQRLADSVQARLGELPATDPGNDDH
jgi:thioesterase domain-containing protein